jgi:EmrB/QacA subfamily drug resistance transporter
VSRRDRGLAVVCGAMFVSAVDMTIVNVALPAISEELNAGIDELQWVIDAFLVTLAGLLLLGSGMADRFGRRKIFLSGMAGFGVASVLCALSPTPEALIAARVLMGASLACVLPPALSLLAVMFPPEERQRALTVWVVVAGVGLVLGPVLGGVLVGQIGWQAVFLVNVPVAAAVVAAGIRVLPESTRPGAPPLDLPGAGLSVLSLTALVFALIEGPDSGWTSPGVIVPAAVGLVAGVAFVRGELRRRYPLFDVRVLKRPVVAAGAAGLLGCYLAQMGALFLIPQYLIYVQDRSVEAAGLLLAPLGAGVALGSHFAPGALERFGPRPTVVGGLAGLAVTAALLILLGASTTVFLVMVLAGAFGALFAFSAQPATGVIMDDVGEEKAGDGGAVNQLARQVGGALGVAIVGTVFAGAYAARVDDKLGVLPPAPRERATHSIEEARDVLTHLPHELRDVLTARVDAAFDSAAHLGFGVCAAVLALMAMFAAVALSPRR